MAIKRLDVPRSFAGEYCNQPTPHQRFKRPLVGRDGWYRICNTFNPIEWIEYQGKVYEPIGSLMEELERLTIEERPLRDCEFGLFRKLLKERPYGLSSPLKSELRKLIGQEALRRSTRRTRSDARLRMLQIRKEQRSGAEERLDRDVDEWIGNLGRHS